MTEGASRLLIINADDCGLTRRITDGILEAFEAKALTATSVMVTTPGTDDALARLRGVQIDIGLHVDLLAGRPLTGAPSLIDPRTGHFHGIRELVVRSLSGRLDRDEVAAEVEAQLQRLTGAGLEATHIDSHRHVHLLPTVWPVLDSLAARNGMAIRVPNDSGPLPPPGFTIGRLMTRAALSLGSAFRRPRAWSPRLAGVSLDGGVDFEHGLLGVLGSLAPGYTELLVHPGYDDPELAKLDGYRQERERELAALKSPAVRARLHQGDITMASFPVRSSNSITHQATATGKVLSE